MFSEAFQRKPLAPVGTRALVEYSSLSSVRDALSCSEVDPVIAGKVRSIVEGWRKDPGSIEPYIKMRDVLEEVRRIPPGDKRIYSISAIVRTLGQPEALATFLDALRDSVCRIGTREQDASRTKLLDVKMHSIYGWCGNTLMVESLDQLTEGTYRSPPELAERLGNSASAWNLTIHIWQPNLSAKGFPVNAQLRENTILEPPHSHPFDFISMVVKGELHQSIYTRGEEIESSFREGYYDQTPLEHVDGVWPPHYFRERCYLKTLEHRVRLKQGDIYYMPCDWIHDVEVDRKLAASKPAITLFVSTEYLVMPHVYMTSAMAEFHETHPDIKSDAKPISEESWCEKSKAISAYLRGESDTLFLNEIVGHTGDYAFFHIKG